VATTRKERALRNVERAVQELRAAIEAEAEEDWSMNRWRRLLTKVESAGGSVDVEEWKRLGRESGYTNPRGLGGFYRGANGSMRREGDRRVLTDAGRRFLDEYGQLA